MLISNQRLPCHGLLSVNALKYIKEEMMTHLSLQYIVIAKERAQTYEAHSFVLEKAVSYNNESWVPSSFGKLRMYSAVKQKLLLFSLSPPPLPS